jgi:hypothetical protein
MLQRHPGIHRAWKADRTVPKPSAVGWRQKATQLCSCLSVACTSAW